MVDHDEVLNRSWDDIPEPKTLPDGSWLLRGRNAAYVAPKEKADGGTTNAKVLFFYEAREAMSDVDASDLAALGDYDISENDIVKTFWIERNKDWAAVRKHLELHGVETKGQSQQETLKAFKGTEVIAYLTTKTVNTQNGVVEVNEPTMFERPEA